jgi:hypothetical protein
VVGVSQLLVLRIGGVSAIVGGVLVLVGNIVHPREPGQLDDASALLEVIVDSEIWVADHLMIMIAMTLLLGAFYGVTHSITSGPGVVWAHLAWGMSIVGVGLGVAFMLTEAVAMAGLAETWAASSGNEKDLALAAGNALFHLSLALAAGAPLFLFGATPVLVGLAMLGSIEYPSWLGWVGVILGFIAVAGGLVQILTGVTSQTGLVLVPIGIVTVTLWILYLGVVMWRRSATVEVSS